MKSIEMIKVAEMIWRHHNQEGFKYFITGMRSIEKVHEVLEIGGLSSEHGERFDSDEIKNMYEMWINERAS